jgi:hypothetical protein
MRLMEKLRNDPRERGPLRTADLAGDRPVGRASGDGRDDSAPAQVMEAEQSQARRRADEPARKRDADVEDAVETPRRETRRASPSAEQTLAPLFSASMAQDFRARWDATQIGFVDNPRQAVQHADELVAQVMKSLAQSFADERQQLEAQMHDEKASTENLRVALQRYRSFFQRLLAL